MAQPGHVVPAVGDAGDVFLNWLRFVSKRFVWCVVWYVSLHLVFLQISIIRNTPLFFMGMRTGYNAVLEFRP